MKTPACIFLFLFFLFTREGDAQVIGQMHDSVREIRVFESVFTVPVSFNIDTVSNTREDLISGKDTIRVTWMNYYHAGDDTSGVMRTYINTGGDTVHAPSTFNNAMKYDSFPVPFEWLSALSWNQEYILARTKNQMNHPDKALTDSFPLLKTHKAQIITNKFITGQPGGNSEQLIMVLTPLANQPGKIYVLQAYDCYKGVDFVFVETSYSSVEGQKRYMKIFRTMKMW